MGKTGRTSDQTNRANQISPGERSGESGESTDQITLARDARTPDLVIVAFPGADQAAEVLKALGKLQQRHKKLKLLRVRRAAVVVRHMYEDGAELVSTHETRDASPTTKAGWIGGAAALVGIAVRVLGGGLGRAMLAGVAAGLVTLLATRFIDLGFKDSDLQQLAHAVPPGQSLLAAVMTFASADAAGAVLDELALRHPEQLVGARVLYSTLPPVVEERLVVAIATAAAAATER
jgi:uncharacterized membrane protein